MADYMQACEIVIPKPGDLSYTETAVEQLLIPDNANLLMQHQRTALSP